MGRDAIKAQDNVLYKARKEASIYNDRLCSREGAAELLGISVSTLADYELEITKVIPVDKIILMSDLYNAPYLLTWYCSHECPIGRRMNLQTETGNHLEKTVLKLLRQLRANDVEKIKDKLVDITSDGIISEDETVSLEEILKFLDGLIGAAVELKVIGQQLLREARS